MFSRVSSLGCAIVVALFFAAVASAGSSANPVGGVDWNAGATPDSPGRTERWPTTAAPRWEPLALCGERVFTRSTVECVAPRFTPG